MLIPIVNAIVSIDWLKGKITGTSHLTHGKIWLVSGESIFPSTNPLIDISIHPYSFFSPTNQITGKSYISWENLWFHVDFPLSQPIEFHFKTPPKAHVLAPSAPQPGGSPALPRRKLKTGKNV